MSVGIIIALVGLAACVLAGLWYWRMMMVVLAVGGTVLSPGDLKHVIALGGAGVCLLVLGIVLHVFPAGSSGGDE